MDFTIITPSLNYGRFLSDCLESVASQEGVTFEHLIIDGGSSDESAGVADNFPHATWSQEADEGMSDAINKGFDRAKGKWVMWLNADDRLKPNVLSKLLEQLNRSNADIVYGNWDFINEAGKTTRHIMALQWSPFVHIHHHCYIGSTAAFYRKTSVLDKSHRLSTDFKYTMDSEFYIRLHAAGLKFQQVPITVADFRMHGSNLSQRNLGKSESIQQLLAAEHQFSESRAIRRKYGITLFQDPYLNGITDGILWIIAKTWKVMLKTCSIKK